MQPDGCVCACRPLGKLAHITEKGTWKGAELVFVRTSQGSQGAVKPVFYCTLVGEMDLSPPRDGPRPVETNHREPCSTFGDNHGSLVRKAADTLLGRGADGM